MDGMQKTKKNLHKSCQKIATAVCFTFQILIQIQNQCFWQLIEAVQTLKEHHAKYKMIGRSILKGECRLVRPPLNAS